MNKQETFETVSKHLFAQGKRSYDEGQRICQYRYTDGTKCAVGCLIPDEMYKEGMEGWSVRILFNTFPEIKELLGAENIRLLENLQTAHDNQYSWSDTSSMRSALTEVGLNHGLSTTFLDDLSFADR